MSHPWQGLEEGLAGTGAAAWAAGLGAAAAQMLERCAHGDLACWRQALSELPPPGPGLDLDRPAPRLGGPVEDPAALEAALMALHPWRKGPLSLGGVDIDTEWRSDWKWDRLAPHFNFHDRTVLDIGCGNGYFGWRMLGAGARCVVGVDPTWLFVMQWQAQAHFAPGLHNYVLPLRDVDLPEGPAGFDLVASMGVLYHQRDPAAHLQRLAGWLPPGGYLLLETLVLESDTRQILVPDGRYARMRNVWHLPSTPVLLSAVEESPFTDVRLVDVTPTSTREQRSTRWMRFESLAQCLDPEDPGRTIEGHPAPVRAIIAARRR